MSTRTSVLSREVLFKIWRIKIENTKKKKKVVSLVDIGNEHDHGRVLFFRKEPSSTVVTGHYHSYRYDLNYRTAEFRTPSALDNVLSSRNRKYCTNAERSIRLCSSLCCHRDDRRHNRRSWTAESFCRFAVNTRDNFIETCLLLLHTTDRALFATASLPDILSDTR